MQKRKVLKRRNKHFSQNASSLHHPVLNNAKILCIWIKLYADDGRGII